MTEAGKFCIRVALGVHSTTEIGAELRRKGAHTINLPGYNYGTWEFEDGSVVTWVPVDRTTTPLYNGTWREIGVE